MSLMVIDILLFYIQLMKRRRISTCCLLTLGITALFLGAVGCVETGRACKQYDDFAEAIQTVQGDATHQMLLEYGIDIEDASGDDHHILPVPAVFIVDTDGIIRFDYVNPDYKIRIDPEELLEAARKVRSAGGE